MNLPRKDCVSVTGNFQGALHFINIETIFLPNKTGEENDDHVRHTSQTNKVGLMPLPSSLPSTMKAVIVSAPGPPENMSIQANVPIPAVLPNTLLIKVAYTALNRADTLQRKGSYPPPPGASTILGLELSGIVAAIGEDVPPGKWAIGDRVAGLVTGGAYSEYCLVEEPLAMKLPPGMSLQLAASIPEAWLTAYQLLHFVGKIRPGDLALIHAGAR